MLRYSVIFLAVLCLFGTVEAASAKVGFINPQVIVSESKVGKLAQEDLARLGRIKDQQIQESAEKLKAIKAEMESGLLSEAERDIKEDQFKRELRKHEKLVTDSNIQIREEERRLIQFVMKRADKILRRLAKSMGFTMILTDPEAIGYIDLSVDLTERVLKELDAGI
ncbi:OmpH/Skp family outer membrane protein [Salidesulfovibrio brasiliensis]|uniref:OmpH family outer membrane protein n=1 Tax=Salidesulfovibrio brasiliensis TaxID=221711 RepID=UPI000AC3E268|nr:OmpH family outer membrane protein [Salidesulfovibrio brasiliensis]